ncbi:unnamed protein product [Cuscuta campestris]|uniref:Uncharacterized protein n=1 Tax=Cuscuta campestris TaxID=132261 RepID=A0A484MFC7_9ASTE|nr:unnamed protein product [Cuscuta campestris]
MHAYTPTTLLLSSKIVTFSWTPGKTVLLRTSDELQPKRSSSLNGRISPSSHHRWSFALTSCNFLSIKGNASEPWSRAK